MLRCCHITVAVRREAEGSWAFVVRWTRWVNERLREAVMVLLGDRAVQQEAEGSYDGAVRWTDWVNEALREAVMVLSGGSSGTTRS